MNDIAYGGAGALEPPPEWSPLDEYLWHTCDILADVVEKRLGLRQLVPTTARIARSDRALAVGPAQRFTWRAAHGALGSPAFPVVSAGIYGDGPRRWVPDGVAELTVTRWAAFHGLPSSPLALPWEEMHSVDLAGPDLLVTGFTGLGRMPYMVLLHTPWASLMFALAAMTAFPAHPRLLGGSWLPPDFERRCVLLGKPCRPAQALLVEAAEGL